MVEEGAPGADDDDRLPSSIAEDDEEEGSDDEEPTTDDAAANAATSFVAIIGGSGVPNTTKLWLLGVSPTNPAAHNYFTIQLQPGTTVILFHQRVFLFLVLNPKIPKLNVLHFPQFCRPSINPILCQLN